MENLLFLGVPILKYIRVCTPMENINFYPVVLGVCEVKILSNEEGGSMDCY